MGKDFYIERPVREKKADLSEYYRWEDPSMPFSEVSRESPGESFEAALYEAPERPEENSLREEFQKTSAPYSSVSGDPKLKMAEGQRGFISNIISTPQAKSNRPHVVLDKEASLAKLQQIKAIKIAQKKSHSEYMALRRQLYRTIRSSQGRREMNGNFRQIEKEMKIQRLDWGTPGFVALVLSYYPEADLTVTQPEKEKNPEPFSEDSSEKDKQKQEEESFMKDELSVATDHHELKAEKDAEGRNILEPAKEEKTEEKSLPPFPIKGNHELLQEEEKVWQEQNNALSEEQNTTEEQNEPVEQETSQEANQLPAINSETPLPLVDNASAILQVNQEPLPGVESNNVSSQNLSAELISRQGNFQNSTGLVRTSLQSKIAAQKDIIKSGYASKKASVIADSMASQKALETTIGTAKVEVELSYASTLVKLKAHLDSVLESADKKKEAKLQMLSESISTKKKEFSDYIKQKEAAPELFAAQEGSRIQTELTDAAELCISQSNRVAARYSKQEQKDAAIQIGQASAKDIREKIQPMKQNVLELAQELKGNFGEYKSLVLAELGKAEEQLKPLIEKRAEEVKESLREDLYKLTEELNQSRTADLSSLDKMLTQSLSGLDKMKVGTLASIENASQQGLSDLDKISSVLLQSVNHIEQDTLTALEGPGEVYLPGVDTLLGDASSRLAQLDAEGAVKISEQGGAVIAGMKASIEVHSEQSSSALSKTVEGSEKVVSGAKQRTEQSFTTFVEKTGKQLEEFETGAQEILDKGFKDIEDSIGKIKETIEAQNTEAKEKIKERTTENIEKAKMPLKDDNESRSVAGAEKAGKEKSWWEKGIVGAVVGVLWSVVKIVAIFVVIVAISALIVLALAAIGFTVGIWTIIAVIGIGLLVIMAVASAVKRTKEGVTGWKLVGLVIADSVGITDIYEGISDKSISDGRALNQTAFERSDRTTTGIFTLVMTFFAVRGTVKGFRTKVPTSEVAAGPSSAWARGMNKVGQFIEGIGKSAQERGARYGTEKGTLKWGESVKRFFKPKEKAGVKEQGIKEDSPQKQIEENPRQNQEEAVPSKEKKASREKESDSVKELVTEKEGGFKFNRKRVANREKMIGEPEAVVHLDAGREAYAAQRIASKEGVVEVHVGKEADRFINGRTTGEALSVDVVGVTKNKQFILGEAKGKNIAHALDQFEHSATLLGKEKVIAFELIVPETIQVGYSVKGGYLYADNGTGVFVQVFIFNKPVRVIHTSSN